MLEVLRQRGFEHESAYVNHLREQGLGVLELPNDESRDRAADRTIAAMREGHDVIGSNNLAWRQSAKPSNQT